MNSKHTPMMGAAILGLVLGIASPTWAEDIPSPEFTAASVDFYSDLTVTPDVEVTITPGFNADFVLVNQSFDCDSITKTIRLLEPADLGESIMADHDIGHPVLVTVEVKVPEVIPRVPLATYTGPHQGAPPGRSKPRLSFWPSHIGPRPYYFWKSCFTTPFRPCLE